MMIEEKEPASVVIAGGGIVGLVLAMTLKKQLNVHPEIYEKTSTFATEAGAGLGMYPNGLRVLRDISPDLLQAVRDAGYPYKKRIWERHDGTAIADADESILSNGEAGLDPIGIRRSSLQKALYKHALSMGIKTNFRKPLDSVIEQDDGLICVKFGDGTSRLTQLLFGADGALGKSRAIVAGDDNPALGYTGVTCLMGLSDVPREGIAFPSSDQDDFHAVFFPTAKNEQCFQFHEPVNEKDSNKLNWGNLSDEVGREECQKIAKQLRADGWHEKYIEPLEHVVRAVRVGFALLEPRLKSWVRGHIALVGDAAHPPVPYVGQGAQQGLEDAAVLVSMLKIHCLDDYGNIDTLNFEKAMRVYQEIRIQRSSIILDFSKSLGDMQNKRSGKGRGAKHTDQWLKGEVLMHGTLPCMIPGAGHDYKDDVAKATKSNDLPTVTVDAAMEALEYLLGGTDAMKLGPTNSDTEEKLQGNVFERPPSVVTIKDPVQAERISALTQWIFEIMEHLLQQILAHHNALFNSGKLRLRPCRRMSEVNSAWHEDHSVIEEFSEVIELPEFIPEVLQLEEDPDLVDLGPDVIFQLRSFIEDVASLYRENPFHNFEHACQVTMSVYRLLSSMDNENGPSGTGEDHTYGIVSDPITLFACVFAALIHDADHQGVPNAQLLKEHPQLAKIYHGQAAIAEQHSINVGWELLMDKKYQMLRDTICMNEDEMKRFRKLVVNTILATDICDKDLKDMRNSRWEKAFSSLFKDGTATRDISNRKATIGIEHLIQASDVSHTMQPWHVYRQWNKRLFLEMYRANMEGRAAKDPSEFWFKGEIGFFDFYIIPLAKKLQQCEVFAATTCDECVKHAQSNREEWMKHGEKIVEDMIREVHEQWKNKKATIRAPLDIRKSPSCNKQIVPKPLGTTKVTSGKGPVVRKQQSTCKTATPAKNSHSPLVYQFEIKICLASAGGVMSVKN